MQSARFFALVLFIISAGCTQKDNNAIMMIMLTDAPADYEEVLIDVLGLQVNYSTGSNDGEWVFINGINTGVYNLLDYTNGLDTLLIKAVLPGGHISQMRLMLGDNNQVKTNGSYYDLETPSAQQSGLKFNVNADLVAGLTYKIWIDFDAGRSVIHKGNDKYSLKPVIRTFTEATSGAIKGTVQPEDSRPYITAISTAMDTIGTYSDTLSGEFFFSGMNEGIYKLNFNPVAGFMEMSIDNVNVSTGSITELGTVSILVE